MLWSGLGIPIYSLFGGTVVKRLVDIAVSLALLVVASPVLALAALIILVTSPGPVLFRQVRMGRGYKPFEILKLRTMVHAAAGLAYTLGPDPRITPVGKWLRRTKVDELPQLWNVLWGEMSLVGPRPVLPELTYEFREYYTFLLRARPGLTDPASLKYSQEAQLLAQADDAMRFFKAVVTPDKIRISFEYMSRANLWTDTVTLAMTAMVCCFPSMSRIYGELPETPKTSKAFKMEPSYMVTTRPSPEDTRIFAHDLAYLEATVEGASQRDALPWIQLQNPDFGASSPSSTANRSASRL
jgi:lipopolysaccharide/colanic/teichoic acid biosynthesis glycosyltransferase